MFRLAWSLRRPVSEIQQLPAWELAAWQTVFDLCGPLDWTRADYLDARNLCVQTTGNSTPDDLLMFRMPEPTRSDREESDEAERQMAEIRGLAWRQQKSE